MKTCGYCNQDIESMSVHEHLQYHKELEAFLETVEGSMINQETKG